MALVAVIALGLAACSDDDDEETPSGETDAPTATPATGGRAEGGELTIASLEPDSLDPHFSSFSQDISLHRMLWRGLYTLDGDNVAQPAMAASLPEISEDGTVYTITIREGLLWSDGDDLTAEDFALGIQRTCNPENAGEYQYVLTGIVGCDAHYGADEFNAALEALVSVEARNDTTLVITIAQEQPTFAIILSLWMTFPAPAHLLPNSSDPWPDVGPGAPAALAYNGPYMLSAYSPGDSAELVPNPNWVGDIEPTLDKITLRFIDDFSVANNAFRTGEVDFANVDEAQLESIAVEFDGTGYLMDIFPGTVGLEMQMTDPTLSDLDVRLALERAIDWNTLNLTCYGGGRVATTSWVPEVSGGHPPDEFADVIGFDVVAAQGHLSDAGFANGEGFPTLSILVRDSPQSICEAEFHQAKFSEHLGITTEVEVVDAPTRSARFTSNEFQLFPGGWIQDYPDPENWIIGLYDTGGSLNNYNCSDPDIDAKIDEAQFNTDNDARLALYEEINELIVTRVCGIGVGLHLANHYLISPDTIGLAENAAGLDALIAGDWIAEAWGVAE